MTPQRKSRGRKCIETFVGGVAFAVCCPFVAIYCCVAVSSGAPFYCGTSRHQQTDIKRRRRRNTDWAKNPHRDFFKNSPELPHQTNPRATEQGLDELAGPSRNKGQRAYEQTNCPLFRLPAEIREQIYAEVLGFPPGTEDTPDRLYRLVREDENSRLRRVSKPDFHKVLRNEPVSPPALPCSIVPFMQSCRRLYSEIIPLIYRPKGTFAFANVYALVTFARMLPRHRYDDLNCVLYLYSGWWGDMGKTPVQLKSAQQMAAYGARVVDGIVEFRDEQEEWKIDGGPYTRGEERARDYRSI